MKALPVKKIISYAGIIFLLTAFASCGPNKNTALSRKYQEFITRYNIYYNGDTHFKETLADMEEKYEDDYSRTLLMHPVEAKADKELPQPKGNFDRSIEKAQKAIQLRTIKKKPKKQTGKSKDPAYQEWMKREEYNPFLHNAWMMLGRSQFYNGDFLGAASTFFYISRHFGWLPATVTEARLMQALSYIALGWQFEAEMIITRIKEDELTSSALKALYNYAYADFYIHARNYEAALPYLDKAVRSASGPQKTRLNFLLGQVYQSLGRNDEAYKAYAKAGGAPSASYRTKFNARIKQSEVFSGSDIDQEVKALKRMTRYDRNQEYLDQIYYAIGNLYLSRGDTIHAIENYELANEKSTRSGIEKALNQLRLGSLYFEQGRYDKAQPNYAGAVPLLPSTYPDYKNIKRRSDVLDELAVYSQNVTLQDSLLRLSKMSPEEQLEIVNRLIKELEEREKKEADEQRRQEYLANQNSNGLQDNSTQSFNINTDDSWYFYNTATKNAGKTEFQKRWGSRKLEDDWRRRNKTTFNVADFSESDRAEPADRPDEAEPSGDSSPEADAEKEEKARRGSDPHYPEYYLSQIPSTEAEIATSNEVIQEGLYNMGVILKDKLEDFPAADAEFDQLLTRYPDNIYRLDTYYNLYLMYMRMGLIERAEKYRALILAEFPDSKYGVALTDPQYIENLRTMEQRQQQLYEEIYQAYLDNRNSDVHKLYNIAADKFSMSKIMPKFMFLNALAYVTENRPDDFNAAIRQLLEQYPQTDMTDIAAAWLKGMAQGRKLQAGISNMRGMIWDMRLSNDSTATGVDGPVEFTLNPETRHLLVFTYPTDEVSTNELLFEIARHNFRSFAIRDFDIETMNFGRLGMIIVRGFENMNEINRYRQIMASSPDFRINSPSVRPIAIAEDDFKILLEQGRSFDDYFRYREEQNYIDAQADFLLPEQIEPLPPEPEEILPSEQPQLPVNDAPQPSAPDQTDTPAAPATTAVTPTPAVTPAPVPDPEPLTSDEDDEP